MSIQRSRLYAAGDRQNHQVHVHTTVQYVGAPTYMHMYYMYYNLIYGVAMIATTRR